MNLQPTAPPQPFAILLVVTPMRRINRSALTALAVTLIAAVPASAAQVTLVRGDRAVRVNDPFVPSNA